MQGPSRGRPRNQVLDELRDQLNDDGAVDQFVTDFLALLDARVCSVGASLRAGALSDCAVVLLTLETSSRMIGASQLAEAAAHLRGALNDQDDRTNALYVDLVTAGDQARQALPLD